MLESDQLKFDTTPAQHFPNPSFVRVCKKDLSAIFPTYPIQQILHPRLIQLFKKIVQ